MGLNRGNAFDVLSFFHARNFTRLFIDRYVSLRSATSQSTLQGRATISHFAF